MDSVRWSGQSPVTFARAVRAELKRSGAIIDREDGSLQAVKRYYVPGNVDEKAITVMSVWSSDDSRSCPQFRSGARIRRIHSEICFLGQSRSIRCAPVSHWSRAQATKFIEAMDDWLAEHESEVSLGGGEAQLQPVLVSFYYEGPKAEAIIREDSE